MLFATAMLAVRVSTICATTTPFASLLKMAHRCAWLQCSTRRAKSTPLHLQYEAVLSLAHSPRWPQDYHVFFILGCLLFCALLRLLQRLVCRRSTEMIDLGDNLDGTALDTKQFAATDADQTDSPDDHMMSAHVYGEMKSVQSTARQQLTLVLAGSTRSSGRLHAPSNGVQGSDLQQQRTGLVAKRVFSSIRNQCRGHRRAVRETKKTCWDFFFEFCFFGRHLDTLHCLLHHQYRIGHLCHKKKIPIPCIDTTVCKRRKKKNVRFFFC